MFFYPDSTSVCEYALNTGRVNSIVCQVCPHWLNEVEEPVRATESLLKNTFFLFPLPIPQIQVNGIGTTGLEGMVECGSSSRRKITNHTVRTLTLWYVDFLIVAVYGTRKGNCCLLALLRYSQSCLVPAGNAPDLEDQH